MVERKAEGKGATLGTWVVIRMLGQPLKGCKGGSTPVDDI